MPFFNRLTGVLLTAVLIGPVAPLQAKTRKGDKYLVQGRVHEAKKEWDAALLSYDQALSEDPADGVYQMSAQKARFRAAQSHLDQGLKIREQGQLGDALLEFQKAYALDPGSSAAEQEIRRTQEMIRRERLPVQQTGTEAPPEERALTPIEEAKKAYPLERFVATQEDLRRLLRVPELRPLNNDPINLKMNNQPPKVLFETVAKVAGINVIWDPEYQPGRNLSLDLSNSTLEEALDDVAILTKSFWKPLPGGDTIFVTNDGRR